jgi:hypothetical protein
MSAPKKPTGPTLEERHNALAARARRSGMLLTIGLHAGPPVEQPTVLPFATFAAKGNLPIALNQVEAWLDEIEESVYGTSFAGLD